jgi:hypothetical protein
VLDLLLKLVDRLVALAKRKEELNRNFYSDFVKPAMDDFEKMHEKYVSSFDLYRSMLADPKHPLDSGHPVFRSVIADSALTEHLRTKILELKPLEDSEMAGDLVRAFRRYLLTPVTAANQGAAILNGRTLPISSYEPSHLASPQSRQPSLTVEPEWEIAPSVVDGAEPTTTMFYGPPKDDCITSNFIRSSFVDSLEFYERIGGVTKRNKHEESKLRETLVDMTDMIIEDLQGRHRAVTREFQSLKAKLLKPI